MNDFITEYKTLANKKNITLQDVIARCLYKAVKAKNPNKKEVFIGMLRRSFSPGSIRQHRPYPYHTVYSSIRWMRYRLRTLALNMELKSFLTEEEIVIWNDLLSDETYWDIVTNLRKG